MDTVSFRIFPGDGENTSVNSQLRPDSVTLTGAASAVPEPSGYALMAGADGLALAGARRRRNP